MPIGIFQIFPRLIGKWTERGQAKVRQTSDLRDVPPEESEFNPEGIPNPQHAKEVVTWVRTQLGESRRAEKEFIEEAKRCYRTWIGDHYLGSRPDDRPTIVVQTMKTKIERLLAFLSDEQWKLDLIPFEQGDRERVDTLQKLQNHLWEAHKVRDEIDRALMDAVLYGEGYLEGYVDLSNPDDETVKIRHLDWFGVFRDYGARRDSDARYWFVVEPMSLASLRVEYGDLAKDVKAGSESDILDDLYKEFSGESPLASRPSQVVAKIRCWVKDERVVVTGESDNVEFSPRYRRGWRYIVVCGDVLLEDRESPFDFDGPPISRIVPLPIPGRYHGDSLVSRLREIQLEKTKKRGLFIEHMQALVGYLVVPKSSGLSIDKIWNIPSQILDPDTALEGRGIHRVTTGNIPPGIGESITLTDAEMDVIIGLSEVSLGKTPSGEMSGRALAILRESDLPVIRAVQRRIASALLDLGRKWLWLIQQIYDRPRVQYIMGDEAYEKLSLNMPTGHNETLVSWDGEVMTAPVVTNWISDLKYDLSVVPTTGFRIDREILEAKAIRLVELGLITKDDLWDFVEFPGKAKMKAKQDRIKQLEQGLLTIQEQLAKGPEAISAPPTVEGG
ncbi:MAG: hypothetical protein AB1552_14060 [Nitrospirota bacterium]